MPTTPRREPRGRDATAGPAGPSTRPVARASAPTVAALSLDRRQLKNHLLSDGCEDIYTRGLEGPEALADLLAAAFDGSAINGGERVEPVCYVEGDHIIIVVRETTTPTHLAVETRQVAAWSVDYRHLAGREAAQSFDGACDTLDAVLRHAVRLIPTLRALQLVEDRHQEIAAACAATPAGEAIGKAVAAIGRRLLPETARATADAGEADEALTASAVADQTPVATQIWQQDEQKPAGYLRRVRARTVSEVYADLWGIVGEYPEGGEEYFMVTGDRDRPWPDGRTVVFSVNGSSEGDYVHVEVHDGGGGRELTMLAKTFDGRDASWGFARRLADLLEA